MSQAFGRMVRFLLVTAQRRDEAASLRHGDITRRRLEAEPTTSRAARMRSPSPRSRSISSAEGEPQALVFGGGNGKISGFSKLKRGLDKASGVEGWRLHDLRRSAATHMQELGIAPDTIRAILNHAMPGVGGVYMRAELEAAKRDALARGRPR